MDYGEPKNLSADVLKVSERGLTMFDYGDVWKVQHTDG